MDRGLWLLMGLRIRAWGRRIVRNARTPRGAILLAIGLLFFFLILGPNILLRFVHPEQSLGFGQVESMRRTATLVLFTSCVMTALFSTGEQGIYFTPAEVQFLFSGPFTRRQILAYKLIGNALLAVVYALFLTAFLFPYSGQALTLFLGLVLTLWFMQFFGTVVSLLLTTIGTRAYTRPRKVLLVLLVVAVGVALAFYGREAFAGGAKALLEKIDENPIARVVLAPMRWFAEAMTAEGLWPDFALKGLLCLAVDAVLVGLIFLLDAQYLEAAAAASERMATRLQRLRGGTLATVWASSKASFGLPMLPWATGIGPIAWRQLTTAVRGLRPVMVFLFIFAVFVVGPRIIAGGNVADPERFGWLVGSTLLGMTFAILTPLLTFDFRGDLDRMDVLKTLPISPYRLALGQLAAPVFVMCVVQMGMIVLVQPLWGGVEGLVAGVLFFAVPFNLLTFGLENLMFLWFPARIIPAAPGDFQAMGRQALMMLAKFLLIGLTIVPALIAAAVVFAAISLLQRAGLAADVADWLMVLGCGAAAWVVFAAMALALVHLVARAFLRFDVTRDTPP